MYCQMTHFSIIEPSFGIISERQVDGRRKLICMIYLKRKKKNKMGAQLFLWCRITSLWVVQLNFGFCISILWHAFWLHGSSSALKRDTFKVSSPRKDICLGRYEIPFVEKDLKCNIFECFKEVGKSVDECKLLLYSFVGINFPS